MSWAEDLAQAPVDPEAAARVLGHVAALLRRGEALPSKLAHYLADAFEVVAAKETAEERTTMLGRELHLVRQTTGRPSKATIDNARWAEVCVAFDDGKEFSPTTVHEELMRQTGAKERTAWTRLQELKQAKRAEQEELQKLG